MADPVRFIIGYTYLQFISKVIDSFGSCSRRLQFFLIDRREAWINLTMCTVNSMFRFFWKISWN